MQENINSERVIAENLNPDFDSSRLVGAWFERAAVSARNDLKVGSAVVPGG